MAETDHPLKDGYWDHTAVIRSADGGLRVRKESKLTGAPGPWARQALRNEIAYLKALSGPSRAHFPPLLVSWDAETIGYEIPYYDDRKDLATILLGGSLDQDEADDLQRQLGVAVFEQIHRSAPLHPTGFSAHVESILAESIAALAAEPRFGPLLGHGQVIINGRPVFSLASSLEAVRERGLLDRLEHGGVVLLHGDLILENILWPPLLLLDPVSVAGLDSGPPLFDLVKYESFASGELYAIREELVTAGPREDGYVLEISDRHPTLAPFRRIDLISTFRLAYQRRHGAIDTTLYALLDAYFSLVMARNTTGLHQWARVIKGCQCLAAAVESLDRGSA